MTIIVTTLTTSASSTPSSSPQAVSSSDRTASFVVPATASPPTRQLLDELALPPIDDEELLILEQLPSPASLTPTFELPLSPEPPVPPTATFAQPDTLLQQQAFSPTAAPVGIKTKAARQVWRFVCHFRHTHCCRMCSSCLPRSFMPSCTHTRAVLALTERALASWRRCAAATLVFFNHANRTLRSTSLSWWLRWITIQSSTVT